MIEEYKATEKLNKEPLNQAAKDVLKKTKQGPDSSCLYTYQLILWGLNQPDLLISEAGKDNYQAKQDLIEWAELLMYQKPPQVAMKFLALGRDQEHMEVVYEKLKAEKVPEEAAWLLIQELMVSLMEIETPER